MEVWENKMGSLEIREMPEYMQKLLTELIRQNGEVIRINEFVLKQLSHPQMVSMRENR